VRSIVGLAATAASAAALVGVALCQMSRQSSEQQQPSTDRGTAAAIAAAAGDHGRRVHELPWLYLDSVGQEYGPVPGWTMREWLTLGRFPVGRELRVRLPEWDQHLPLHQLYPDLATAFVLPPAWPSVYVDEVLQGDDADSTAGLAAVRRRASAAVRAGRGASGASGATGARAAPDISGRWVPLPRLWKAGMAAQQRPGTREDSPQPVPPPAACDRPEHEEQLLPPPPPQPSQQQLRELFSQPQEGPLPWEDERAGGSGAVP